MDDSQAKMDAAYATFYAATGEVIREWAETELTLEWYLGTLLATETFRSRIVWDSMPNIRARLQLLNRLASTYVDDPVLTKFRGMLKRCKTLCAHRNMLAHSLGGVAGERGQLVFVRDTEHDRLGYDFINETKVHINHVKGWAIAIAKLRKDLFDFLPEFASAQNASTKMHRELHQRRHNRNAPTQQEPTDEAPQSPPQPSQP